jgi:hypothetical protein
VAAKTAPPESSEIATSNATPTRLACRPEVNRCKKVLALMIDLPFPQ